MTMTTERDLIEKVQRDPDFLGQTKGQTLAVCMAAVKTDGLALRHVAVQTPEMCRAAIEQNQNAKKFARIPEPIYMEELDYRLPEKIKGYGYTLRGAKRQPESFCLEAVLSNGDALRFVREQTPLVCWAAVMKSGTAVQYVKNQTPEICLAAVRNSGLALRFVRDQLPIICLEAVIKSPSALRCVRKNREALLKVALALDPDAKKYLKK